ncbi:MAG: type I methionyl aminopeptidase [Peptoanaerobacter stomatis]|uniref:type I methionyl aminopeptidase n=1 Tax=Peptoanaerobacter stomatis TaxID=796937 RepID=UPI003FA06C9B
MITIKSKSQIQKLRDAGRIVAQTHQLLKEHIKEGITTYELDYLAEKYIRKCGAIPSFKGYGGFKGSICASLNSVVVHGIPSKDVVLKNGDIISIDIGAFYNGYHGDSAKTHAVGEISEVDKKLIEVTKQSFYEGIKNAVVGNRLSDISHAVQVYVEKNGFSVIRDYVGHGVGEKLHEDPQIPNYGNPGRGPRLQEGMVIAVEPMVAIGTYKVKVLQDGWTAVMLDGKNAAHYEHTLTITDGEPELLTIL